MILIITSQFDKTGGQVVKNLELSTSEALIKNNYATEIVHVPGAVEIPLTVKKYIEKFPRKFSAVICLGCVIKGDTDHYELVINAATDQLSRLAIDLDTPIIQGILACKNEQQALDRQHHGKEYAETAIHMTELFQKL